MQNLLSSSLLSKNLKIKIHKNRILPVILYGCETWSFTLREERRLRLFENRVLRKIFGPSRDKVTGEWRKLHNKELNDLYCSPNIQYYNDKTAYVKHIIFCCVSGYVFRLNIEP